MEKGSIPPHTPGKKRYAIAGHGELQKERREKKSERAGHVHINY